MKSELKICIPLMDELENLPTLIKDIGMQEDPYFRVYFCINQPDIWWDDETKRAICEANQQSIAFLKQHCDFESVVIDRSGRGKGWQGKQLGVGWARKVCMDTAANEASDQDIIVSLDGDTRFGAGYFSSVRTNFQNNHDAVGLSVPYYHKLTGKEMEDRSILRYEIYMRNYAINLWRINNPYAFTALGSAMALPVKAYKAIGGMTPKKSGEDFYFLQKLCKYGKLLTWNIEKVYPAARFSDRVFFGTGPAMIKGSAGNWESYPIYHHSLFDKIKDTYDLFEALYEKDVDLPADHFIREILGWNDAWQPLRENNKGIENFKKACSHKLDGFRILQYLKYSQKQYGFSDESSLLDFMRNYYTDDLHNFDFLTTDFTFDKLSVEQLDRLRNYLAGAEESYQLINYKK